VTTPNVSPKPSRGYTGATGAYAAGQQIAPTAKVQRSNYQPIILMEFIGCILLTAVTPVATKKDEPGLSPYAGADMVKLAAITVLYFILAAISVGGRGPGRLAAWFGGLILIVDGMYEASNIAKDLQLLSGGLAGPAASSGGSLVVPGLAEGIASAGSEDLSPQNAGSAPTPTGA
jgi:hypothetical protein